MHFANTNHRGDKFTAFYVARDAVYPGWLIYGRNAQVYGRLPDGRGAYVMLCGYVRHGKWPKRNCAMPIGWRTKREATAALAAHLEANPHLATES